MKHLSLDLETLDTRSTAVVLAIGAVFFDPITSSIDAKFHAALGVDDQLRAGRTVSGSTLKWWAAQSDAARAAAFSQYASPTVALNGLTHFIAMNTSGEPVCVWGYGAEFDNAILASLHSSFNRELPWRYSNSRCARTLCSLVPKDVLDANVARVGVHHDATDDAEHQARRAMFVITRLGLTV